VKLPARLDISIASTSPTGPSLPSRSATLHVSSLSLSLSASLSSPSLSLFSLSRDLKPENVLIHATGHIKLCDFGFATVIGATDLAPLHDGCGTAMYVAPEIAGGHMKLSHGLPVDWWSLGCILYEMIVGTSFDRRREYRLTSPLLLASQARHHLAIRIRCPNLKFLIISMAPKCRSL
jgi:serine/threonine protein kinase